MNPEEKPEVEPEHWDNNEKPNAMSDDKVGGIFNPFTSLPRVHTGVGDGEADKVGNTGGAGVGGG